MKVETYETAVLDNSPNALVAEGEMLELIKSLGLEGQLAIAKPVEGDASTSLCPYRVMTKREMKVYGLCFPRKTALKDYKDSLIPLRVLQVAAHAKEWFPKIMVWHPEPGKPDPLLVGYTGESWNAEPFLLARWGDALDPFETLVEKAKTFTVSKFSMALKRARAELAAAEALIADPAGIDIEDMPVSANFYTNNS